MTPLRSDGHPDRRYGRPSGRFVAIPMAERLNARRMVTEDSCWLWTGKVSKWGYGQITVGRLGEERTGLVHRVAYEFYVGPIPEGLEIDHLCRQPSCFNPQHLEAVTPLVNASRKPTTGVCHKGHVMVALRSANQCLICRREYRYAYYRTEEYRASQRAKMRARRARARATAA